MAAVLLSLRRVGWDMESATVLVSDEGLKLPLTEMGPKDVGKLLFLGIQRWQGRRIAARLCPDAPKPTHHLDAGAW